VENSASQLTFIGTATTLLRLGAFTLLTDPNFLHRGQRAYLGNGLWSRRLTEPSTTPEALPRLDAIVLSHLHGDHFDRVARRGLTREAPIITTVSAAHRLRRYDFATVGLDTWGTHTLKRDNEELTIGSTPAIHARRALRRLLPPVMGSLIEHRVAGTLRQRIHISGDTLSGSHLDEIRARFPGIDTSIVHLGGTRILWQTVTMDGAGGADYLRRVQPRSVVPVHYDDYRVFKSPLRDFVAAAQHAHPEVTIRVVRRGNTIDLDPPA